MQLGRARRKQTLAEWLTTARARLLVRSELRQLQSVRRHLVGFRLLQIGRWGFPAALGQEGGRLCRWIASPPGEPAGDFCFDGVRLPLASGCMDAVILPHALELSASPHQLLREVDRVLSERGQLVLLGFNPLGPWALAQHLRPRGGGYPAATRLFRPGRVCDWLDLLDFEVVHKKRFGLGFPYLPRDGVCLERPGLWRLPAVLGQAYMLVARKRVIPLSPLPMPERPKLRVVPGAMPEPSARVGHRACEAA